jgi:hypothetical protein
VPDDVLWQLKAVDACHHYLLLQRSLDSTSLCISLLSHSYFIDEDYIFEF